MAKYIIVAVLAVLGILMGASIAKDLKEKGRKPTKRPMQTKPAHRTGDVLVATWTGNADDALAQGIRTVAGMVLEQLGSEHVALASEDPELPDLEPYHILVLGAPAPGGKWPAKVADLLGDAELAGKVLVPFCTYDIAGKPILDKALKALVSGAQVLPGYSASLKELAEEPDNVQKDIYRWLWDLNLDTK